MEYFFQSHVNIFLRIKKKKLDIENVFSIFFPSPSSISQDDLIRIDTKVRCNFEGKILVRKCGEIRECTIMGKNGWHDDNRRGVDIPCGNQAHYRGTGRVYGLVNQIEGWVASSGLLFCGYTHLPLPSSRVACEKLRIVRFKGRRRREGEIAARRSSINQDSSIIILSSNRWNE